MAIEESDLILLVADVREGLTPFDKTIAKAIAEKGRPYLIVANKYDTDKQAGEEAEFYCLGARSEDVFPVSSAHGLGMDPLICRMVELALKSGAQKESIEDPEVIASLAILGSPNARSSQLF